LLKIYIGRSRPVVSQHGPHFEHLRLDSRHNSFPSGHTALAFALARAIDDEIDNRFLEVGLYSLGTVVGWSRVQQDEHWLSDVTAGAIAGITVTRMLRDGHLLPRDARVDFRPGGVGVVFPVDF
jgi:membrane-associated phospholipid phosphatase